MVPSSPLCGRAAELTARLTGGSIGVRVSPTESRIEGGGMIAVPQVDGPLQCAAASPPASPPATQLPATGATPPMASSTLHSIVQGCGDQPPHGAAASRVRRMSLPTRRAKPLEIGGEPLPLGGSAGPRRKGLVGALNNRSTSVPPAKLMSHTSPNVIRASLEKAEADGTAARLSLQRRWEHSTAGRVHKRMSEILEIQVAAGRHSVARSE